MSLTTNKVSIAPEQQSSDELTRPLSARDSINFVSNIKLIETKALPDVEEVDEDDDAYSQKYNDELRYV